MPSINDYTKKWYLSELEELAETHTSTVYLAQRDGQMVVLKLLKDHADEERRGVLALKHWEAQGAIVPLAYDDGAQLLEYAPGPDLVAHVMRGDDLQATQIISGVLNQLHSHPVEPDLPLPSLRRWFRALFLQADTDTGPHAALFKHGAHIAEQLLSTPQHIVVLHGDIHHENVRYSPRGWLAIDPKGIIGERTYDCANTLCNPPNAFDIVFNQDRILANAHILADATDTDLQRVLNFTFAYACLSASWTLEDGDADVDVLEIARLIAPLLDT